MSQKTKAHIRYKVADGTIVPGCTTVLGLLNKPALVGWANRLGLEGIDVKKYVDDKADIGTLGHAMVTDKLAGETTDTSEYSEKQIAAAENCALSFWEWEKNNRIEEVYFVERPFVSETHRYGGTQDVFCRINGKNTLLDLKTGSGIYDEHILQVASLKVILEEHFYTVDKAMVLNIPRTEDERFLERVASPLELTVGWKIFENLLNVYWLKKTGGFR